MVRWIVCASSIARCFELVSSQDSLQKKNIAVSANEGHSLAGSRRAACSTCGKESLVAVKKEKASGRWKVESGKCKV